MANPNPNSLNGSAAGSDSAASSVPQVRVLSQYVKDISFENPNAPKSFEGAGGPPNISIQVNVNARQIGEMQFEVTMILEGGAAAKNDKIFQFELNYAGIFQLENIPEEDVHPVVMIECPRLLFPFARQLVANAVQSGGFPPLYVDPIDFAALYRQRAMEIQAEQEAGQPAVQ